MQYIIGNTRIVQEQKIRCTCARCKAFNDGDSTGRTLSIGQQIGETESKTGSTEYNISKEWR